VLIPPLQQYEQQQLQLRPRSSPPEGKSFEPIDDVNLGVEGDGEGQEILGFDDGVPQAMTASKGHCKEREQPPVNSGGGQRAKTNENDADLIHIEKVGARYPQEAKRISTFDTNCLDTFIFFLYHFICLSPNAHITKTGLLQYISLTCIHD
jgi:hypothetical protein